MEKHHFLVMANISSSLVNSVLYLNIIFNLTNIIYLIIFTLGSRTRVVEYLPFKKIVLVRAQVFPLLINAVTELVKNGSLARRKNSSRLWNQQK